MSFAISNSFYRCRNSEPQHNCAAVSADLILIAVSIIVSCCLLPSAVGTIGHYVGCASAGIGVSVAVVDVALWMCRSSKRSQVTRDTMRQVPTYVEADGRFRRTAGTNRFKGAVHSLVHRLDSSLERTFKKGEKFKEGLLFNTGNYAKKEDLPYYQQDKLSSPEFAEHVAQYGYMVNSSILNKPYCLDFREVNLGACLCFCKDWLRIGDFGALATKYQDGLPYEAVATQSCYKALPKSKQEFREAPKLTDLEAMSTFIGLEVTTKFHEDSPLKILRSDLATWDVGAYYMCSPVYEYALFSRKKVKHWGTDGFVFIKENDASFYFYHIRRGCKKTTTPTNDLIRLYVQNCKTALLSDGTLDPNAPQKPGTFQVHEISLAKEPT